MFKNLKNGIIHGLGFALTVSAFWAAYAAYSTLGVANGDQLSSSKWNEVVSYTVPPGAVMAFNLASCPNGWSPADGGGSPARPDLRGEFIRGLDSGRWVDAGRGLATSQSGTSLPSLYVYSYSSTSWIIVSHPVNSNTTYPNDATATNMDSVKSSTAGAYMSVALSPTWSANVVSFTTRPRNVALLYCVKN